MPLPFPPTDPTPIVEIFRGSYATELLTAAVAHLGVFKVLADGALASSELQRRLDLAHRPFVVLLTALRAMGLIDKGADGRLAMSALASNHLTPGGPFFMGDYIGLAAESPGVRAMVERLRSNRAALASESDKGSAYTFRDGAESAMDHEASARRLTLALAGRARNVAPVLADKLLLTGARRVLDIGGGTGLYSIAFLQRNPSLRAMVWDRAEVLKVARELAHEQGVADRMEFIPGDMFADAPPTCCDVMLLSNILHDWDLPECRKLVKRCAEALPSGGRLLIHDVFLNDELDGPLPVALYSAALFSITEGRAYSAAEYRTMLAEAGLKPGNVVPTFIHCGVLTATKA